MIRDLKIYSHADSLSLSLQFTPEQLAALYVSECPMPVILILLSVSLLSDCFESVSTVVDW